MSDTESSGSEPIRTGREADNFNAGLREMPAAPERKEKEITVRDAAEELASRRSETTPDADPVFYTGKDGNRAPANEAITLKRAADDLAAWRKAQSDKAELHDAIDTERATDQLRRDEGITPEEPNAPQLEQPQLESTEPSIPGLDPEVARMMKNPSVVKALEQEFEKVAAVQTEYGTAVQNAYNASLHFFAESYPEFRNLTADKVVEKMQHLAQTNPQRYQAAYNSLLQVAQVEKATIASQ
jgi:hypothetical protein